MQVKPALVVNLALPYQDLNIMDACLAAGVNYLDTANYEPRDEAKFEYSWQWAYQDRFKDAGLMALLGSRLRSRRDLGVHHLDARSTCSTASTRWTSWTATAATPACRSRPTSIPRSTCAK